MCPTDRTTAMGWVADLTRECDPLRRQIPALTGKRLAVVLSRFDELNSTRCRVIEEWGLRQFSARLIRDGA